MVSAAGGNPPSDPLLEWSEGMGEARKLISLRIEISNALISFESACELRAGSEVDFEKHQILPVLMRCWRRKGGSSGSHG